MVTDLIEFARGLGARMPLRRELTDFGEVCHHIVEETRNAYPSVDLQTHSEGELSGYWDRDRVAQALSNLVVNAVQHGSPPVRVSVRDSGDAVILEVTNRGLPIASEALSDLFEPFSRTTGTDGLGLGLFIVSEIVGAHGGTIDVHSDAESTRFVSRWPRGRGQQ
jgi:signal transduction histidine kinase